MSPQERVTFISNVSISLAPAFRDKFDFSDEKDYDKLADRAWLAAEAIVKKREAELKKCPPELIEEVKEEIKEVVS